MSATGRTLNELDGGYLNRSFKGIGRIQYGFREKNPETNGIPYSGVFREVKFSRTCRGPRKLNPTKI